MLTVDKITVSCVLEYGSGCRKEKRKCYACHTTKLVHPRGAIIQTTIPNKLANRVASLAEKCDVDEEERQFTSAVCGSPEEICPITRQRTQSWISEACLDLID